jgi:voltage-gated potassium channel
MNHWRRWVADRFPLLLGVITHRRIRRTILVPILLVAVGTAGYCVIDHRYSPLDALYMTVITLATIGYGEVHPLTDAGRVFTICLILGGVFVFYYAFSEIIRAVVSGEVQQALGRQRMERSLAALANHFIVCGYGRMGRMVCLEFSRQKMPFVIVEKQPQLLEAFDVPHGIPLAGDASSDDLLRHAGIERARALITVMSSDAENLYTTMSARLLNKHLFIVARVEDPSSEQKLRRAGANRVVSPYQIGGLRLAHAVLRPTVVDFIELTTRTEHFELQLEETRVHVASPLAGTKLGDGRLRGELKLMVVAIKKHHGEMLFNPDADVLIEGGDTLVVLGRREHLARLEELANRVPKSEPEA